MTIMLTLGLLLSVAAPLWADTLEQARGWARQGQPDFAFLAFRAVARDRAGTPAGRRALLAIAEYYAETRNDADALHILDELERTSAGTAEAVVAACLRYDLLTRRGPLSAHQTDALRRAMFDRPLVLLFSNDDAVRYDSPWGHRYVIRRALNRLEVLKNGATLLSLTR